jgi:hypothetical protein
MAGGTVCETGETGENAVVEQIKFLTGLTGLPAFSLYLQSRPSKADQ